MGLESTITGAVADAFTALGDLVVSMTYLDRGTRTYDTATGAVSRTDTSGTFSGFVGDYHDREIGELIQAGDRKITVKAAGLGFEPTPNDQITFNGETWDIVRVKSTYAGDSVVIYQIQVRR